MSRLVARRALLVVATAAALPLAKGMAQDRRELARRVDAAVVKRNTARLAVSAFRRDSIGTQVYPDTMTIAGGTVAILTTPEFLPLVRAAAGPVDSLLRYRAGSAVETLRGTVFVVRTDSAHRAHDEVLIAQRFGTAELKTQFTDATPARIAAVIEDYAQGLLGNGVPTFGLWSHAPLPVDTATDYNWSTVRAQLVTSLASVARQCYAGNLNACKVTLGLTAESDPVMSWYDSTARRAVVELWRQTTLHEASFLLEVRSPTSRCLAGSDRDCIALLRTDDYVTARTAPGSPGARSTLIQQAFAMGGAGALQRLIGNDTSSSDRLAAAAKAPFDTLLTQWLRNVRTRGSASENLTPGMAIIAIGWIIVVGALSLRISRWR
jgi:hypothetical protein